MSGGHILFSGGESSTLSSPTGADGSVCFIQMVGSEWKYRKCSFRLHAITAYIQVIVAGSQQASQRRILSSL
jgi:hypothetical protein